MFYIRNQTITACLCQLVSIKRKLNKCCSLNCLHFKTTMVNDFPYFASVYRVKCDITIAHLDVWSHNCDEQKTLMSFVVLTASSHSISENSSNHGRAWHAKVSSGCLQQRLFKLSISVGHQLDIFKFMCQREGAFSLTDVADGRGLKET